MFYSWLFLSRKENSYIIQISTLVVLFSTFNIRNIIFLLKLNPNQANLLDKNKNLNIKIRNSNRQSSVSYVAVFFLSLQIVHLLIAIPNIPIEEAATKNASFMTGDRMSRQVTENCNNHRLGIVHNFGILWHGCHHRRHDLLDTLGSVKKYTHRLREC